MIGLIFGDTSFPIEILKKVKKKKLNYLIIDLSRSKKFKKDKKSYPVSMGHFGKIINILKQNNCKKALFAGKVSKPNFSKLKLDLKGIYYIPRIIRASKLGDAAILKEVIKIHRITALFFGFIGALIIIRPGYIPVDIGTILMLIASLSFSFVLIMVKKLSEYDSSLTIIFYHLFFMTPLTFLLALFFWESISLNQLLIFILMAIMGLISHWCLAQAFKLSDTTVVMPLQFTKLIWASIIGFYYFIEHTVT